MQFVQPIPFQEAIDLIGDKTPIGAQLSSSEWQDVPVALRQRAMFSANVENARFLQRAQSALGDFLAGNKIVSPDGETVLATGGRAAFIQQMREFAKAEGMGPLGSEKEEAGSKKDLQNILSERRLGLIFDTQTRQAGDYGYWRQGQDPDVLNEFPAQRFIRVLSVKEPRLNHIPYENQVYLKTDPIWARVINQDFGTPWGPFGWGCGHDVEDVDRQEAISLGLLDPRQRIAPDVKNFNENLEASALNLPAELLRKLEQVFGRKIEIANDTIRWVEPPARPEPAAANPRLQKALASVEADLAQRRGTEKLVALDPLGNTILQKEGAEKNVVIPRRDYSKLQDAVITHNHPQGTSFSSADMDAARGLNLSEIRIVGVRQPFTYVLHRPAGGWPAQLGVRYDALFRQTDAELALKIMSGEMTEEQAQAEVAHLTMEKLAAELDLDYERF